MRLHIVVGAVGALCLCVNLARKDALSAKLGGGLVKTAYPREKVNEVKAVYWHYQ
jgi:hypothetical protein